MTKVYSARILLKAMVTTKRHKMWKDNKRLKYITLSQNPPFLKPIYKVRPPEREKTMMEPENTDRCMKDFCASLSRLAILSNKALAVPRPSPASFQVEQYQVNMMGKWCGWRRKKGKLTTPRKAYYKNPSQEN